MFHVTVKRVADVASDHDLLLGNLKMKFRAHRDSSAKPHRKHNILIPKCNEIAKMFNCTVKNKFSIIKFLHDNLQLTIT